MRRISVVFILVFGIEIVVFLALFLWFFGIASRDELGRVDVFSTILAALGSTLLTSGLVYHSLCQRPELKILDVVIDPWDARGNNIAEAKYTNLVFVRDPEARYRRYIQTRPETEQGFQQVRSTSRCARIRVSTDVCNVGVGDTTVHEYSVTEAKPSQRLLGRYVTGVTLPHQKRTTLDFNYPEDPSILLSSGEYEFEITVSAATESKSRRIDVIISDDLKTIRWKRHDC